ncbi:MAG: alpha/beta hydrolase [Magnetococcales bacterium]|nr:alpha/beta hydrolase [Magnetococcales bacterium]
MKTKSSLKNLFFLLLFVYVGACAYLYLAQDQKIFMPTTQLAGSPSQWGVPYEEVNLTGGAGRLHGWWLPGGGDGPVLLFFHGNNRSISLLPEYAQLFQRTGWPTLMLDYRGYGESVGEPSEAGLYADAQVARNYVTVVRGIAARRLIYYGHSLGSGVATWLAGQAETGGVILDGAFTSVPDRAAEIYPYLPVRWLARTRFDNLARMAGLRVPLLVMHSREDTVIPFHHGEQLFAAAREPKTFLEVTGPHAHAFPRWPGAVAALQAFGKRVMAGVSGGSL